MVPHTVISGAGLSRISLSAASGRGQRLGLEGQPSLAIAGPSCMMNYCTGDGKPGHPSS